MKRPEHPDFWLISQGCIDQDAQADNGQSYDDMIGRYADMKSVIYAAEQRALRLMREHPDKIIFSRNEVNRALEAVWVDAFIQGCRFQAMKQREAQS